MSHPESAYSPGQRLRALIVSVQTGTAFRTVLKQWEPAESHPDDVIVRELQHALMDSVRAGVRAGRDAQALAERLPDPGALQPQGDVCATCDRPSDDHRDGCGQ